jgi:hypothetical protein
MENKIENMKNETNSFLQLTFTKFMTSVVRIGKEIIALEDEGSVSLPNL